MTPDELIGEWAALIQHVVGSKGQWRKEQLTLEEWRKIDDLWLTLKQHELRRLAMNVGRADHE